MSLLETTMGQPLLLQLSVHSVPSPGLFNSSRISTTMMKNQNRKMRKGRPLILCCSDSTTSTSSSSVSPPIATTSAPPLIMRRKRYRRLYPGESKGITEEMRFVAMGLRNIKGQKYSDNNKSGNDDAQDSTSEDDETKVNNDDDDDDAGGGGGDGDTWLPSIEGFIKYLVDSKLVFNTVERIVDESDDVSYAYFRKTGLERSEGLARDLEWFSQEGFVIPKPSSPGVSYAKYLGELSKTSAPLFLSHFYNIYFSHIAGGQVIARQVSDKLLERRELGVYSWEGDMPELMKGFREKLNMLGEHWTRDEKNKCLKEATKSFRFLGQIVRLIIL